MIKKIELNLLSTWIPERSKILDLGCGNGELMHHLKTKKNSMTHGVEISEKCIYKCVEKGLSVFHSNIENGLSDFPDNSFDFVIFYQTLQQIKNLNFALNESLRVGKEVIVGFPNFAHYNSRLALFFKGRAPVTKNLPHTWYDSPNLHFFGVKDFIKFCKMSGIKITGKYFIDKNKQITFLPNLFAERAIFKLTK